MRALTRVCSIGLVTLSAIAVVGRAVPADALADETALPQSGRHEPPVMVLDRLLAIVGDHPVTLSDVRAARVLGLVPDAEDTATLVGRLIDRELMRIEVDRFTVAEPPAEAIDARIAAARKGFSTPDAFEAAVRSAGLRVEQVRAVMRDEVRIASYLEQRFGSTAEARRAEAIDEWVASLRRRTDIKVSP
ncbi:MAG: hypothetical protein GEU99_07330 [Luteitalea sp.]|nr:hypothetical protein [Luteitalea sp.]